MLPMIEKKGTHMPLQKILIVDDDPEVLSALKLNFVLKYKVFLSSDPHEALHLLKSHGPFPVIMSDLKMPRMNGLEFLEKAQEVAPGTIAILLTGQGEVNDAIRAVNSGIVFRYLCKPCNQIDIAEAIENGVEKYQERCQKQEVMNEFTKENTIAEILQDHLVFSKASLGQYIDFSVRTSSFKSISGDFYEVIPYKDECYDVIIADVMGKGLSAALAAVAVKNVIHLLVNDLALKNGCVPDISDLLHLIEMELHDDLEKANTFITLFYLRLDLKNNRMTYISRGHPGAVLLSDRLEEAKYLGSKSLPLGVMPGADHQVESVELNVGDQIILYSDGIVDTLNERGNWQPVDLIVSCLDGSEKTSDDVVEKIFARINQKPDQLDDMTLLSLKIKGVEGPMSKRMFFRKSLEEIFRLNKFLSDSVNDTSSLFKIAALEVFTNIVKHSDNQSLPVEFNIEENQEGKKMINISYEGVSFEPEKITLPDCNMQTNGFGLYLIKRICESVDYTSMEGDRNCICLTAHKEVNYDC